MRKNMSRTDLGKTKKCARCGKKFVVNSPTQIYCSATCRLKEQHDCQRIYKGIQDKPIIKRSPKGTRKPKKTTGKKRLLQGLFD